ncbi:helix-turn-helix domain-containing protein [Actinocrinis puniceicyclus]|uniref:Helix-turn-helix domain-containing protein n=1 Tax=Actinocrinis puniceicyclus TaxID=977794 RepID=A0A8J7WSX9_9ACTN|nr:helix-turn-helix domain-containing protein [Actinocrinis puniceicyclus]MBS2965432.1 helix-turn-helix domain-containing protein [Actinocrinis puniceicyclus]
MAQEQGGQREPHRLIGEQLQRARLAAGLSARQISERTRITPEVLQRIEAGRFDECGGDVYARGHIRAYAQAVGLDPAPLLTTYGAIRLPPLTRRDLRKPRVAAQPAKEAVGTAPRGAQKAAARRARSVLPTIVPGAMPSLVPTVAAGQEPEVPPLKHARREDFTDADAGSAAALITGADGPPPVNERPAAFLAGARASGRTGANWSLALVGALAAVGLVAAVQLWPGGTGGATHATSSATADARPHSAATPARPASAAPVPSAAARPSGVDIRVVVLNAPSWLGVTDSAGKQLFWNILQPGQSREFTDSNRLSVILGDAAAVDLVVNGHDLGPQGGSGQVFRATYGPASGS